MGGLPEFPDLVQKPINKFNCPFPFQIKELSCQQDQTQTNNQWIRLLQIQQRLDANIAIMSLRLV